MVRSGGVVIGQDGPLYCWSVCQCQVDDRLAFLVLSCPMLGGPAIISKLQSILVNHVFPESSIPLHVASWVPSFAVGIEVSREDSAALPNDSLPVQLSRQSLSRMRVLLVLNVDDPRYPLHSPPDVGGNDIFVCNSAQISPLINHQAAPSPYRCPNSVSFSYFIYRMADPNTSSFSRWLLQAHNVRLAFDSHLPRRNRPLV